jgi:hypothetical protein
MFNKCKGGDPVSHEIMVLVEGLGFDVLVMGMPV